jgi:hypothetical protein
MAKNIIHLTEFSLGKQHEEQHLGNSKENLKGLCHFTCSPS